MLNSLNGCSINAIISGMGAYKTDIDDAVRIFNGDNQTAIVAFDIKYYTIIDEETGVTIHGFNLCRDSPRRLYRHGKPLLQGLLGIGVFALEIPQHLAKQAQGSGQAQAKEPGLAFCIPHQTTNAKTSRYKTSYCCIYAILA